MTKFLTTVVILLSALSANGQVLSNGLSRTEWAGKFSGGPVKVVFMAPYGAQQDSYELMRRFEFQGTVVPVSNMDDVGKLGMIGIHFSIYWPELVTTEEQVIAAVREALATDWQVLVLSAIPDWSKYPDDIHRTILDSVRSGKSLMITDLSKSFRNDLQKAGLSLKEIDPPARGFSLADRKEGSFNAYRCGQGYVIRYAVLNDLRMGYLLSMSARQSDFERSAARVGWILRWAANPAMEPVILNTAFQNEELTVRTQRTSVANATLSLNLRRVDSYETPFAKSVKIKLGTVSSIALPHLPGGAYQAEVTLTDREGKTIDWDASRFAIQRPVRIKSFRAESPTASAGQRVTCRMDLEGPTNGLRMIVRWFDQWNRLLLETQPVDAQDTITVTAPANSCSVINRVQVTLVSNNGPEDVAAAEICMADNVRPADDFYVLYWNGSLGESWRHRLFYDALRRTGQADAFSNCPPVASCTRNAALAHLRTVPYTTHFHNLTLAEQILNEKWLSDTEKHARETARSYRPYNAMGYTLGDENYISAFKSGGRFCDTPEVWRMFQAYLQEIYPDLKALNTQWGTGFSAWTDIRFTTEKEMLKDLANPSAWTDFRMFVSRQFAAAYTRMRNAIHDEHPGAPVGWDGAEQYSSYDGYDWWQITRGMELIQVYNSCLIPTYQRPNKIFNGEAAKSFRPKTTLSGGWMNNTDLRYGGVYDPWYMVLNGWNSIWWFAGTFLEPEDGACQWNLTLHPIVDAVARTAREIKDGPGTMLAHAEKQLDPIAIHYSENNFHASTFESGIGNHVNNLGAHREFWMASGRELVGRYGNSISNGVDEMKQLWSGITPAGHCAAASKNLYLLLHDLGFTPRTMARQEIEAGALTRDRMKVLVLPFVASLSDAEAEKIRQFVRDGGLLIADYRCGVRDVHGRIRPAGVLDDVFGIARKNLQVVRRRQATVMQYRGSEVKYETVFHESLTAQGSKVFGFHDDAAPAFFYHEYGKGKAVYLNGDLYAYDELRTRNDETDVRELVRSILIREIALFAPLVPEHRFGHALGHTQVTRLRDGRTWYFGILPDFSTNDKSSYEAALPFPPGYFLFDVRTHACLGRKTPVVQTLDPGQPKMYAAVPYFIAGVQLEGPRRVPRGQPVTVKITVQGATDQESDSKVKKALGSNSVVVGPHAVRVVVQYPDQQAPEHFSRTMYLPAGQGTFSFTPALNEPVGIWRVQVTEGISGRNNLLEVRID